jgi:glycosyltransferase involved in cell wall biosynthesis
LNISNDRSRYVKPLEQLKDFGRKVVRRYPVLRPYAEKAVGQVQSVRNTQIVHIIAGDGDLAQRVLNSPYFDLQYYRQIAGIQDAGDLEAAWHYIKWGEPAGLFPCRSFDPVLYRRFNPDLAALPSPILLHYTDHGHREGRTKYFDAESAFKAGQRTFQASQETVVVVLHEASMTGAPILGLNLIRLIGSRYNVVTVVLRRGDIVSDIEKYSVATFSPAEGGIVTMPWDLLKERVLRPILDRFEIKAVVANSVETDKVVIAAAHAGIPVVSLIHEFSEYVMPFSRMRNVLEFSTKVVFSSQLTLDSALTAGKFDRLSHAVVLPQGKSVLPTSVNRDGQSLQLSDRVEQAKAAGRFLCIGCGYVQIRKGVDLFISVASKVCRKLGNDRVDFIWIGDGYDPANDPNLSVWLQDQIVRSGLSDNVSILPAVGAADLENLYRSADAMILSSRLDPFPNVAIDALHAGLPIVCFEKASGIAEYISREEGLKQLVVPYLDAEMAAEAICGLVDDPLRRNEISLRFQELAAERFDMREYVATLCDLVEQADATFQQQKEDISTLSAENVLSSSTLGHTLGSDGSVADTAMRYVSFSGNGTNAWLGTYRRPFEGFSPHIYSEMHPEILRLPAQNPLAHWIRNGRPEGKWKRPILDLSTQAKYRKPSLRTALHIHLHYSSVLDDLVARLDVNDAGPDLYVSATSDEGAQYIRKRLNTYKRGSVEVRVTPNRGRDIGPMLSEFGKSLCEYDIIGHFHGKKSVALKSMGASADMSDIWREFLLQHLIGDRYPAFDRILEAFNIDEQLGLVFPEDPTIVGWTANYEHAQAVARRIGLSPELPQAIEFPAGNMFLARPDALRPLFEAQYDWSDYPEEPLSYDGTMLHAIERLTPLVCEKQGYHWMATHAPGYTR